MIAYRTFSDCKWIGFSPVGILRKWETVRQAAGEYANEVGDENVIAITESAFGNSPYAITVTVWYRER